MFWCVFFCGVVFRSTWSNPANQRQRQAPGEQIFSEDSIVQSSSFWHASFGSEKSKCATFETFFCLRMGIILPIGSWKKPRGMCWALEFFFIFSQKVENMVDIKLVTKAITLPETSQNAEKMVGPNKERIVFQSHQFSGVNLLFVSGRVNAIVYTTVDGSEILHQMIGQVVYPILYRAFYIQGGAGFLPSTVLTLLTNQQWGLTSSILGRFDAVVTGDWRFEIFCGDKKLIAFRLGGVSHTQKLWNFGF